MCCRTDDDSTEGLPAAGANTFWTTERSAPNTADSVGESERLAGLSLRELRQRAQESSRVDSEELKDAIEAADPKAAVIRLVLRADAAAAADGSSMNRADGEDDGLADAALRSELGLLKFGGIRHRALVAGLDHDVVEEALECDDPHAALVLLLVQQRREVCAVAGVLLVLEASLSSLAPQPPPLHNDPRNGHLAVSAP